MLRDRACLPRDMFYCLAAILFSLPLAAPVTKTYSHNYIHLHVLIYIHIQPYIQVCISFIPMSIIIYLGTYAFTYSCTPVLMYSCTHLVNVYHTATVWRLCLRKKPLVYILYISGPANNLKIPNTPTECPHPHLGIV